MAFNEYKDRTNAALNVALKRQYSTPLDVSSVFATLADLQAYVKQNTTYVPSGYEADSAEAKFLQGINPYSYVGQIVAVEETGKAYIITAVGENGAYEQVGADAIEIAAPAEEDGTPSGITVTKSDKGYDLKINLGEASNNLLRLDEENGGLYAPPIGYIKDTKEAEVDADTVDAIINLTKHGENGLKGSFVNIYTKQGVEKRIAEAGHASMMLVQSVDIANTQYRDLNGLLHNATKNVIYLVKDTAAQGEDVYLEYALVDFVDEEGGVGTTFVLIGDTSTDLSNVYTKDEVNALIPGSDDFGILGIASKNKAIVIDNTAVQTPELEFKYDNSGKVQFSITENGLKGEVDIPEVTIPDIEISSNRGTLTTAANTAFVISQLEVDDENGHKIIETPLEIVTKDILRAADGKVDPTKVFAQRLTWIDDGDGGTEPSYTNATLDEVLQVATASKDEHGRIFGNAGLLSVPDKYKLDKLVIGEDGEVGISGTISAENVVGINDKIIEVVTGKATGQLGIERNAQVNKIEVIKLEGEDSVLEIAGADKSVTLPLASSHKAGIVKGSDEINHVYYKANGVGEVGALNVNRLIQNAGEELILFGGGSGAVYARITIDANTDGVHYIEYDAATMRTWEDLNGYHPIAPADKKSTIVIKNNTVQLEFEDGTVRDIEMRTEEQFGYRKPVVKTDAIYNITYFAADN